MATKNITPNTLINAATTIVGAAQAASKGSKRSMNKRAEDKATEMRRATDVAPAPEAPAPEAEAPAPSAPRSALYTIAPKAKIVANNLTLQRGCTVPVGAQWRANGHKAPNTRHVALSTIAALGSTFSLEAAAAALKPLKDAAILGSGTPASYIKAFLKSGYIVEVA